MMKLSEKLAEARRQMGDAYADGALVSDGEEQPRCEVCGDLGVVRYDVPVEHPLFGKLVPCPNEHCAVRQETERTQWQKRLAESRLPGQFAGCTFASWQKLPKAAMAAKRLAFEACRAFCANENRMVDLAAMVRERGMEWPESLDWQPKNSLVLYGDYGVGKTGLAAAAFNNLVKKGVPALYIAIGDLFLDVQATFRKDADETTRSALRKYACAPLLFVDDLQVFSESDFRIETVEYIIRKRHGDNLPTLVTTNLNQEAFRAQWRGAAAHRLIQMAHWIHVPPPVLRSLNPGIGGER